MKRIKLIGLILLSGIVIFLLFTNATTNDFKNNFAYYIPPQPKDTNNYIDPHDIVRRDRNYFVRSHFTWSNFSVLGVAGNFFETNLSPGTHEVISQNGQVLFDRFVTDSAEPILVIFHDEYWPFRFPFKASC